MTKEELDRLGQGPELDAHIFQAFFGDTGRLSIRAIRDVASTGGMNPEPPYVVDRNDGDRETLPAYSTNPADADRVLRALDGEIVRENKGCVTVRVGTLEKTAVARTREAAICLVALMHKYSLFDDDI
jgi:hypothetical protein